MTSPGQQRILTPTSSFSQLFISTQTTTTKQQINKSTGKENPAGVPKYSHPHSANPSRISQLVALPVSVDEPRTMDSPHLQSAYASALSSPFPPPSPYASPPLTSSHFPPPSPSHLSPPSTSRPAPPPQQYSYHRPTVHAAEPTMVQLLASTPSGVSGYASRLQGQERDATMGAATGVASWRKGQGFKQWEKVLLESPEVRRKADVAQLCESSLSRPRSPESREEGLGEELADY